MTEHPIEKIGETKFGHSVYAQDNEVGGTTYYSDECGAVFPIWDTAIASLETMRIALEFEEASYKQLVEGF
jgi:hypothetical protein